MANTKISQLPTFTGDTTGAYLVMDNSGLTETFKVLKETLIGSSGTSGTTTSLFLFLTISHISLASLMIESIQIIKQGDSVLTYLDIDVHLYALYRSLLSTIMDLLLLYSHLFASSALFHMLQSFTWVF